MLDQSGRWKKRAAGMSETQETPLFSCKNCADDFSWPAADLALYKGERWCLYCWDDYKWELLSGEDDDEYPISFCDLERFVPKHEIRIAKLEAAAKAVLDSAAKWTSPNYPTFDRVAASAIDDLARALEDGNDQ